MQQAQAPGQYGQAPYGQPHGQPYGAPQAPIGGGGSFLGTAAAAAAGVVGGSLLLGSIRSMMGGGHQRLRRSAPALAGRGGKPRLPWSDQSGSDLARDAGINDIGSSGTAAPTIVRAPDCSIPHRTIDDHDDMDLDSDDFGGDGDSDYA